MKKIFFLLFILTCAIHINAQTQIATLCHEDSVTSYYGANGLINAYNAAVDGDVITLSQGQFNAITIKKFITIKGAGMEMLNLGDRIQEPTILSGAFSIYLPSDSTKALTIEGICHEDSYINMAGVYNTTFIKCSIAEMITRGEALIVNNLNFVHCKIYSFGESLSPTIASVNAYNSYFEDFYCKNKATAGYNFTNCIIKTDFSNIYKCYLKNCILIGKNESSIHTTNTAHNCIWQGTTTSAEIFSGANANRNNFKISESQQLFLDNTFYELTNEGKSYKGLDGTEIGIYGGSMSYSPIPFNLQITKCNVAAKTTADGKLSVEIEVKSLE